MTEPVDVVIIGAGLSGLVAGLTLQRLGQRVLLLERRERAGGLCGTFEMDGYEFTLACNDFGLGMKKLLDELGVPVRFEQKSTIVHHGERRVTLPLGLKTAPAIASDLKDWLRLGAGLLRRRAGAPGSLGALVDELLPPSRVADLAKLPAYLMGVAPDDLSTEFFAHEKTFGYGYTTPMCPVGGPRVMAEALESTLRARGGELRLGVQVDAMDRQGGGFLVRTSAGDVPARAVISTAAREAAYAPAAKRGLPVSVLCLAVDEELVYPPHVHTLVHFPPGVSSWFGALDRGAQPEEYGFHVFCSDLPRTSDHYTLNVFFYLPRGVETLSASAADSVKRHLLARLERLLPGVRERLIYARLLAPAEFERRHGLPSRVMPFVIPPGAPRPGNYAPDTGIFHAGHTVYPPGEHAGAAALSGKRVAELVAASLLGQRCPLTPAAGVNHEETAVRAANVPRARPAGARRAASP